ncbi:hypothetical protein MMC17_005391 [Xylographa soralifera]|nr:hypothetical protein [Xylographa soralifera]
MGIVDYNIDTWNQKHKYYLKHSIWAPTTAAEKRASMKKYFYCSSRGLKLMSQSPDRVLQLLHTCRQIHDEALPIFYAHNRFFFLDHDFRALIYFLIGIGRARYRHLRTVVFGRGAELANWRPSPSSAFAPIDLMPMISAHLGDEAENPWNNGARWRSLVAELWARTAKYAPHAPAVDWWSHGRKSQWLSDEWNVREIVKHRKERWCEGVPGWFAQGYATEPRTQQEFYPDGYRNAWDFTRRLE